MFMQLQPILTAQNQWV